MKPHTSKASPTQLSLLDRARQQLGQKPTFWKPGGPDDGIEGPIVRIAQGGRYNSTFYHLKIGDDIVVIAASPTTVLGEKLAALQLEVGDRLAVLYLGEEISKSGNNFKNWSVVSEKPDTPKGALGIFDGSG